MKVTRPLLRQKEFFFISVLTLILPQIILSITEPFLLSSRIASLLIPLGVYSLLLLIPHKPGYMLLYLSPVIALNAFQLVLLYMFGESVIAVDMFTNMVTSNRSEAGELLNNIWPSIIGTCLIYIPTLIAGFGSLKIKGLNPAFRKKAGLGSLLILLSGLVCAGISKTRNPEYSFKYHIFPVNAIYNLGFSIQKWHQSLNYPETSRGFSFQAGKKAHAEVREIYILVIGEASRACNWSLFGYERETNPLLKGVDGLILFPDVLSESNTTHKSVPMLLSAADPYRHEILYQQKSIVTAFKEAGFKTLFSSNQAPNHSITEDFSREADESLNFVEQTETQGLLNHPPDEKMLPDIQRFILSSDEDLFIVIHSYGSHFEYKKRYTKKFAKYQPDSTASRIRRKDRISLVNAYDNSILQTDFLLKSLIDMLGETQASGALLYVSDHGEDLLDDRRQLLLHSSPIPTYYQLHVPMILWFSEAYKKTFSGKVQTALSHREDPVSTSVVFHSLLDIASIYTPYADSHLAVTSSDFALRKRMYLNDHDKPVYFRKTGLKKEDISMLKKHHIDFEEIPEETALQ